MDSHQTKSDSRTPFAVRLARLLQLSSIRSRLILVLAIFSILPVAVTGLFINTISANFARAKVQENLQAVTALKSSQIKSWSKDLRVNLSTGVTQYERNLAILILRMEPGSGIYETMYKRQLDEFNQIVKTLTVFEEMMLLDGKGKVILSTSQDQVGKDLSDQEFFNQVLVGGSVANTTFTRDDVYITQPLAVKQGVALGVLVGRANINPLYSILGDKTGLGATGEIYLVSKDKRLLTPLKTMIRGPGASPSEAEIGVTQLQSDGVENALSMQPGAGAYDNFNGVPVIGAYQWIPELQAAVITEQNQSEAYQFLRNTQLLTFLVLVISSLLALLAALSISNSFARPLTELADAAKQIAGGNLDLRARTKEGDTTGQVDEINALAVSFNSMTAQLRNLIGSLENRVTERTRQLQVRSDQLMTASEVGRDATSLLDTEQLIRRTVGLIKESFDLYYVGLFTVDESGEWAVLKAGTGAAGEAMLRRGHRLSIGRGLSAPTEERRSMIGWCITNNQARIALEALDDPVRLATPDLPDTRSEAAIPLRSRGQVLGAMTIQSAKPGAFDKETIAVFQNMADQVAVALDNARLFTQIQSALESSHQAYAEITRQAWQEKLHSKPVLLRRDSFGLSKKVLGGADYPVKLAFSKISGAESVTIPIRTRGQTIGYINAKKRPSASQSELGQPPIGSEMSSAENLPKWRPDEVKLLESLIDQMGIALDSARLFEESQLKAKREQTVGDITSHIRATLDIHDILQTAGREMRAALDLAEVEIRLREVLQPAKVTGRLVDKGQPRIQPEVGYRCTAPDELVEVTGNWTPDLFQVRNTSKNFQPDPITLIVPVFIRSQVQGVIKLSKLVGSDAWTKDEIELVETLGERLGAAVESARLYEETRRRAERERLTSEIIAKMRSSNDPRTILQTAASELRKALNVDRAQFLVKSPQTAGDSSGEPATDTDQTGEDGGNPAGGEQP